MWSRESIARAALALVLPAVLALALAGCDDGTGTTGSPSLPATSTITGDETGTDFGDEGIDEGKGYYNERREMMPSPR